MRLAAFCVAASLVCGCATVDRLDGEFCTSTADGGEVVEVVQVMNTNWLLLSFIPLVSGDPRRPNECSCSWFYNSVTLRNQMRMLEAEAKRVGATRAVNVFTDANSESAFFLLLKRAKMHTSAVLVKDPPKEPVNNGEEGAP